MARATGYMITYDDANYMVTNEGFTRIGSLVTGKACLNRSEIEAYMNADSSYFTSYANNRLVPYQLLIPGGDTIYSAQCYPSAIINTGAGWTAFSNILNAPNSTYASYVLGPSETMPSSNLNQFNPGIPTNAVIQGLTLTLIGLATDPNNTLGIENLVLNHGSTFADMNTTADGFGTTTPSNYINGSATVAPGSPSPFTVTQLNDSTGLYLTFSLFSLHTSNIPIVIDAILMTVYYTIPADTTPPSQVTGLATYLLGDTAITIGWDAATDNVGVTGYRVEWSLNGTTWNLGTADNGTTLTWQHTGLTAGTPYYYRVRAFDAAGNNGVWSATHSQTTSGGVTLYLTELYYGSTDGIACDIFSAEANIFYTDAEFINDINEIYSDQGFTYATSAYYTDGSGSWLLWNGDIGTVVQRGACIP